MGRTAGHPARSAVADRPSVGRRRSRPSHRPIAAVAPLAAHEGTNEEARAALAAQEAANAEWMPASDVVEIAERLPAPSSGLRLSVPDSGAPALRLEPPAPFAPLSSVPPAPLSFKVYTLDDLERRSEAPVSLRTSYASFDTLASRGPSRAGRVLQAVRQLGVAALGWAFTRGLRPSVKDALREPFDGLGEALRIAVVAIDWKKLGVTTGIVVGASLTILFAVLTAAELTDDLRPGAAAHLASSETSVPAAKTALDARAVAPATNMAAMGVQPVEPGPATMSFAAAAPPAVAPANARSPSAAVAAEPAPPTPASPAKRAAKKPAKPKAPKLGYRTSDALFNP
jgi:hypothetical protein